LAGSIAVRVSRLCDVERMRLWLLMTVAVLVIWLGGAAVTKFTLEQMAFVTPLAVVVVGVTVGIVLLWVKIVRDSMRRRRD
jgi:undecaprenyl pyrophosphate phosphatase UppP